MTDRPPPVRGARSGAGPVQNVSRFTLIVAAVILPFLVVASLLLYLAPANTEQHFAWTITPPITAMYLASAYVGGVWFFGSLVRVRNWQRVQRGFPAVLTFATLLGIATLLHWDRFHAGHLSFIVWTTLYVTTPFLIAAVLLVERKRNPVTRVPGDLRVPLGWRGTLAAIGGISLFAGITLFLIPTLGVNTWAWELTPLTARVLGATLTLPGMVNLWFLVDARWSAFRILFQAQILSLCFILAALLLSWSQLNFDRPSGWLLIPGLAGTLVVYSLFYLDCESRARRGLPVSQPPVNPRTA